MSVIGLLMLNHWKII